MNLKIVIVTAAVIAASAITAAAHGGATGVVKERMEAMTAISKAMKSLSTLMRGEVPFDAESVKSSAGIIKSHSDEALTKLFPEGSLHKPSEAREEIWTNWDEFKALSAQLGLVSQGLQAAAENGLISSNTSSSDGQSSTSESSKFPDISQLAQMPADGVFKLLAKTCSSCHSKFRIKKN